MKHPLPNFNRAVRIGLAGAGGNGSAQAYAINLTGANVLLSSSNGVGGLIQVNSLATGGDGGTGTARTVPAPVARMNKKTAPAVAGRRRVLAGLTLGFRSRSFAFFDELLDLLSTFLSNTFVEIRAVAIARRFAALLSTFLADLLVELVAVG